MCKPCRVSPEKFTNRVPPTHFPSQTSKKKQNMFDSHYNGSITPFYSHTSSYPPLIHIFTSLRAITGNKIYFLLLLREAYRLQEACQCQRCARYTYSNTVLPHFITPFYITGWLTPLVRAILPLVYPVIQPPLYSVALGPAGVAPAPVGMFPLY